MVPLLIGIGLALAVGILFLVIGFTFRLFVEFLPWIITGFAIAFGMHLFHLV